MGVPNKIRFFFWGFEVTYPRIFEGSDHHGAFIFTYTYDLGITPIRLQVGGCLTAKNLV
jgi:hypothetical protein